jgi:hypothetical protein
MWTFLTPIAQLLRGRLLSRAELVFFVIQLARRLVLYVNAAMHPTGEWICQQLREAFPFDTAPCHLILDRDARFGGRVVRTLKSFGTTPVRTAFRSPWQNGLAERWVSTARCELFDHVGIFDQWHLRRTPSRDRMSSRPPVARMKFWQGTPAPVPEVRFAGRVFWASDFEARDSGGFKPLEQPAAPESRD